MEVASAILKVLVTFVFNIFCCSCSCSFAITLGPAHNEFGYNQHPAITSNFFP